MLLLITYVLIALIFSFLCSISEAVILSVTMAHIALLEQEEKPSGPLLRKLKEEIDKPLAAILILNTTAHTVGAVGAGAQAAIVFGNAYVGIASGVLTFLILVFSEIIPKTLGAHYWRDLAPVTAYGLKFLIWTLYPFVKLSKKLTGSLAHEPNLIGFSRSEFSAIAEISSQEGQLSKQESEILKNLLRLRETRVEDAMTPRTVVFSLSENISVEEYFHKYDHIRFSRIPVYADDKEQVNGFVLRSDMLLAQARGNTENTLKTYCREIPVLLDSMSLAQAFDEFLQQRSQIMLIVDEYGGMEGILTLEDFLETLLGLEIVDEGDKTEDMQKLARSQGKRRVQKMDLDIDD
jgi:CBS domain containing-hemolysin-like protein